MNVILIPAYKPDEKLVNLVDQLQNAGLKILVVDDGSGKDYRRTFDLVRQYAEVVGYEANRGKGAALKYGFSKLMEIYPECTAFVTVDADGQHKIEDIMKVCKKMDEGAPMVVTMRDLKGKIPVPSFMGNTLSRWVYTLLAGRYYWDNQSGLRGFSAEQLDWLMKVQGDKYDYELSMLYYADLQHIDISVIPIETVYIDDNDSSHFHPVKDTTRLYIQLFASAWPSLVEIILYQVLVFTIMFVQGYKFSIVTIPTAGLTCAFVGLIFKTAAYRNVRYKDRWRSFLLYISRSCIYGVGCTALGLLVPELPLIIAFDLIVIFIQPCRYLWHQLITDRNRRRPDGSAD